MDVLALNTASSNQALDLVDDLLMQLYNDEGPIVVRDWPDGYIPLPTIAQVPSFHLPHEL